MLVDYHTHHWRCGHAVGQMDDYVVAAIDAGLDEIGLSDHSPIYHFPGDPQPRPLGAMHQDELDAYFDDMRRVRERFSDQIIVRLGVESDYVLGWDEHYRRLWQRYPLDYVIGSVHWLGHWSIFDPRLPPSRDAMDVYAEYLRTTQAAARSGVFDIIGHLDCLKTAGHIPDLSVTPLVEETIRVLAETGVAIELNTSGWRKPFRECFPRAEWLACCASYGVPVTLGSDAHAPEHVGYRFDDAIELLRSVGYREYATFAARQRSMVPIMSEV
jgi:histidinol-phosphatase (PHP family)